MLLNQCGPRKPSNIYSASHFSKNFGGSGKCNLENIIHGKTTFTSFLLRSSQIIGSDEKSIEILSSLRKKIQTTPKEALKIHVFKKPHTGKSLEIITVSEKNY